MSKKNELFEKIKAADKCQLAPVEVPEWGLTVYIKQLTVGERDAYETEAYNSTRGKGVMDNPRSKFLVRVLCDESGRALVDPKDFMQRLLKTYEVCYAAREKQQVYVDMARELLGPGGLGSN